jgi:hypothetical protein
MVGRVFMPALQKIRRRLKPRLHKRSLPPQTEENKDQTAVETAQSEQVALSSTHGGGFCLSRRGFNRRFFYKIIIKNGFHKYS